jgi:adenylosuccinate lyase
VIPELSAKWQTSNDAKVRAIFESFSEDDANSVKNEGIILAPVSLCFFFSHSERVTNHDVKAVEYFIKKKFDSLELSPFKEYIHFGLTSQDINNTAIPLSLKVCFEFRFQFLLTARNSWKKSFCRV